MLIFVFTFTVYVNLQVHMKNHSTVVEVQSYTCSICEAKFDDSTLRDEHEFQHDLVSDSSLFQPNLHDLVISIVDDTMLLGNHELTPATAGQS